MQIYIGNCKTLRTIAFSTGNYRYKIRSYGLAPYNLLNMNNIIVLGSLFHYLEQSFQHNCLMEQL